MNCPKGSSGDAAWSSIRPRSAADVTRSLHSPRWGEPRDLDGHRAQGVEGPPFPAQREPGEEQQVERVPEPDPGDHEEDAVAQQVLEELRDVRGEEVGR